MTERKDRANKKVNSQQQPKAFIAPNSPTYPPYATFVDVSSQVVYDPNDPNHPPPPPPPQTATAYAYIYPVSPQYSVQYYSAESGGQYRSYPGSPVLHPHLHYHTSPPLHPSSPPFSPTLQYHQPALSSPTHAFVVPHQQPFPPLHISSPILNASGSPPHLQFIQPLPVELKHLQEEKENSTQLHPQNIYVRGLSSNETDDSFLELVSVYGPIVSSKAMIDQKTGECKGYGFAMFEKEEHCQIAIKELNAAGYQASLARVGQESFSSKLKSLQDETSTNIYISNLPLAMDEEGLEELFKPYQIISSRILRDPQSGLSRGVGFARLGDRHSASIIIEKYNGLSIDGSSAPLQVRFADSPAQKKLKSQTTNAKKTTKNHRLDNILPFPIRPMMPITPETMLGIAPSTSNGYPRSIVTTAPVQNNNDEVDSLTTAVEHLGLKEKNIALVRQ